MNGAHHHYHDSNSNGLSNGFSKSRSDSSQVDHSGDRSPVQPKTIIHQGNGLSGHEQRHQHTPSNRTSPNRSRSRALSITPPKLAPFFADPSSSSLLPQKNDSRNSSTSSQLGGSRDSLGSTSSRSGPLRRASFNLATGPLNLNPSSTTSLASPSSPSYSTIAVARARAAAAAAASAEGQGATESNFAGSGVFPGIPPFSYSSSSYSSPPPPPPPTSFSSSSKNNHDIFGADLQINGQPPVQQPSTLLASSSSSLHSSTSTSPTTAVTGKSDSGPVSLPLTHLQDNAIAEREVSMILQDFLYLGGELIDEDQITELESHGVKRILNVAENCDDEIWIKRFGTTGYLKVGLRDHVDQDLKDGLDEAIKFIAASKTPIYVHCQAGKSRSVATVIGYLIQECHWPLKRAYDHVVERRRCMSPNIGFVSQLVMLEERVLGLEKAGGIVSVGSSAEQGLQP
ncbi:hypothetical protein BG011_006682 [Mortierella polycephala]|uniref:protein-tyrosine-phosphatase n=1 Tax=Mortierella polycephala TaxID=41804 RepID=A0A9P6PTW7_9FUNG|nr:hypothetical protein BG011_006682 [Mortierella polycephala]